MTWSNLFPNASARVKAYTEFKLVLIQHILCTHVSDTGPMVLWLFIAVDSDYSYVVIKWLDGVSPSGAPLYLFIGWTKDNETPDGDTLSIKWCALSVGAFLDTGS